MGAYSNVFFVIDDNVRVSRHWLVSSAEEHGVNAAFGGCISVKASENSKTFASAESLIRELLRLGADRTSFIVGVGGGVVTDLTGFVASVYMRGVDFGFIPTTLLAQVDAAYGGKNGVNLDSYKNIIGCFRQPCWISSDVSMLRTLPQAEWKNGLAEMLKTFILFDAEAYSQTVSLFADLFGSMSAGDTLIPQPLWDGGFQDALRKLVEKCAGYKMEVVRQDETEKGLRRLLNLGHTFAHAIEKCSGESVPHGQAVAAGMVYAAEIAVAMADRMPDDGRLRGAGSLPGMLKDDFGKLGLMTCSDIPVENLFEALRKDKKSGGDGINFILPVGLGRVSDLNISFDVLREVVYDLYKS